MRGHSWWAESHGPGATSLACWWAPGRAGDCSRGIVEWGLFRQLVGELVAGVEGLVRQASPFADLKRAASDVVWLEPRLVAEVSYSELMEDRLRDPVLRELRVT